MNTEKMYYPDNFCCICMNKSDLKHLFEVDSDGVSHYNKLTSSVVEMNFKEMNNQRLICGECCVTLNKVYDFRQMCLRSKTHLISQLQKSDHSSGTVRVCPKDIKPELIVVKSRGGSDEEGSNCLEGSKPQNKFQISTSKENIGFSASIKKECESEDDSSAYEEATVNHVNGITHIDVKVEDIEHKTKKEDYSEYTEFDKIEIEEDPLAVVKEEPMSDTETPQDGSTSQADTETSEGPNKSYACVICRKVYKNKKTLTAHKKSHSENMFECEICNKGFKQKEYLTAHIKKHSSERPYECEICNKNFKQKDYLTAHIKTHSNERLYECEICKKGFNHKWSLTVHMKTHSSEKPYECEICKKCFNFKSNLTAHMETHSSNRPHECEICKKRFDKKISWIRHMKKKHVDGNF